MLQQKQSLCARYTGSYKGAYTTTAHPQGRRGGACECVCVQPQGFKVVTRSGGQEKGGWMEGGGFSSSFYVKPESWEQVRSFFIVLL